MLTARFYDEQLISRFSLVFKLILPVYFYSSNLATNIAAK